MMDVPRINSWTQAEAQAAFLRCCGAKRWAEQMSAHRPFSSEELMLVAASETWWALTPDDWREAFAAHPKIGDQKPLEKKFAGTAAWSAGEQAGVAGSALEFLRALAEGNQHYEAKFGYLFIVCATGKTAAEMLALLNQRLPNPEDVELRVAAEEQEKITRLRLEKLCS